MDTSKRSSIAFASRNAIIGRWVVLGQRSRSCIREKDSRGFPVECCSLQGAAGGGILLSACWYTTAQNELALLQRRPACSLAHDVYIRRAGGFARVGSAGDARAGTVP